MKGTTSLIVGTFNGILINWNLETGDIISRSSIDEYQHREAVTSIAWLHGSGPALFTSSTDGKVLNWNPENLDFPVRGVLLKAKNELEGATCISVSEDSAFLIIAAESGKLFKFNVPVLITQPLPSDGFKIKPDAEVVLNNLNPTFRQQLLKAAGKYCVDVGQKEIDIKALFINKPDILKCFPSAMNLAYERHDAPVTEVACNSFHRNLFASGSADGTVKVFSALQGRALLVLEPVLASKVLTVAWSEARPLVLAAGYDNGSVYIYDFLQSKTQFIIEIANPRNSASKIRFNHQVKDYLAIGYRNGDTKLFQLPEIFNVTHPDEVRRLGLFLESIMSE
jgi:WD40 repeat protein